MIYTEIGEVVKYNGRSYQCEKGDSTCIGCGFYIKEGARCKRPSLLFGCCTKFCRKDRNYVIFKEIEE
nr:MAG TPA: hypothetical protein [Caudoviricetes sp.]